MYIYRRSCSPPRTIEYRSRIFYWLPGGCGEIPCFFFLLDSDIQSVFSPVNFALYLNTPNDMCQAMLHQRCNSSLEHVSCSSSCLAFLTFAACKDKDIIDPRYICTTRSIYVILPICTSIDLIPYGCTVVVVQIGRSILVFFGRRYVQFVRSPFAFALDLWLQNEIYETDPLCTMPYEVHVVICNLLYLFRYLACRNNNWLA